ncbi:MAG: hypothetical protein ACOVMT_04260 [Caulobacter sp.]
MAKRGGKNLLALVALVTIGGLVAIFGGPLDVSARLFNFAMLTEPKLIKEAHAYIDERTDGRQAACLYVVNCDGGSARLTLVSDLATWNLEDTKRDIWRRGSSGFCPGRTTNIGLQLIPEPGAQPDVESHMLSRWSFFNDRFIPRSGRFQSGAFSDKDWEPCTLERALIRSTPSLNPQTPPPVSADH